VTGVQTCALPIFIRVSELFSNIIKVYDIIEFNIYKIRKISSGETLINKLFLKVLSFHIYIKKNGFCKKDY
jgi:hypothetical protein